MAREDIATFNNRDTGSLGVFPMRIMQERTVLRTRVEDTNREVESTTSIEKRKDRECRRFLLNSQKFRGLATAVLVLAFSSVGRAEVFTVGDGIPDRTNQFEQEVAVVCWSDEKKEPYIERFNPPKLIRDFGDLKEKFLASPVDRERAIEGLNTCGQAQWHAWLVEKIFLAAELRGYRSCSDRLSLLMAKNGTPPINAVNHPFYPVLKGQTEYLVPFGEPAPFPYERSYEKDSNGQYIGVPIATVRHYQEQIRAALASLNLTFELRTLCEASVRVEDAQFNSLWQRKPEKKPAKKPGRK